MEMPSRTDQHEKLAAMVGEWAGRETMYPSPWDPKGGQAESQTITRSECDGFYIVTDYVQKRNGQISYRGHGVMGWDPRERRYTMRWFDTTGFDPGAPALGTWEGRTLCFAHQQSMGHSRYTYEFTGPDTYTFKLEQSKDGKNWIPFIEGTYRRV